MPYTFPGLVNNAIFDNADLRTNFIRIERALRQLSAGSNPLGSGTTVTNVGGIGGDGMTINQVDENDVVGGNTEGILVFGRGETDNLAHAIRTDNNGEILIAELPGVTLAAAHSNTQAMPASYSIISTMGYGKRASLATNSTEMGRLCLDEFREGGNLAAGGEDDLGLLTMAMPKVFSRQFSEFQGTYGNSIADSVAMNSGTFLTGARLHVHRFSHGLISFTAGVSNTPPSNFVLKLYGYATSGSSNPQILLKTWEFTKDDFITPDNSQALEFDITMPFLSIEVTTSGGDATNNYSVGFFYLNLSSI